MRLVLIGDGESPHLLKWARALQPRVDLWAVSSRGFLPGFDDCVPAARRLALATSPHFEGGNVGLLLQLPRVTAWLRALRADWLHAHYLSSHGTLAWLSRRLGVRARLCGSAWGSDILVTPARSRTMAALTRRVLRDCTLATSDSQHMARRMVALGAGEVMVFPFGLEALPADDAVAKDEALFFANRGLESVYDPERVLRSFAAIAADWPEARLVVANDGSLAPALHAQARAAGLRDRVRFTGRLDAEAQADWYRRARWYFSLPRSDSVSVSVLEAMAHGCVPLLSDLPANRELVDDGRNGRVLGDGQTLTRADLAPLQARAPAIARDNRAWVQRHALFEPAVADFVVRLQQLSAGGRA